MSDVRVPADRLLGGKEDGALRNAVRVLVDQRLAEAAREMSAARHPADTLQRIATMAVDLIDACDVAGVCVLRPGRNDTCAHTHASLQVMDDLQHDLAEGPSMSGNPAADMVSVGDLSRDARWPRWGSEVVDRTGVRLGRGAGFYDRSLPLATPTAKLVAVVRDDELVDRLPAEPHDVRMTHALTPNGGVVALG